MRITAQGKRLDERAFDRGERGVQGGVHGAIHSTRRARGAAGPGGTGARST